MTTKATSAAATNPLDLGGLCGAVCDRASQPMVAVEGQAHIVRYLNPAFARLFGKTREQLVDRSFAEAVPERRCLAVLDRVFQSGTPERLEELEHRQNPPVFWSYEMWAIFGGDERPAGVMIQVTDATEAAVFRQRATAMNEALVVSSVRQHELIDTIRQGERDRHELEVQICRAQKLESLGVLAGGIAHDLNNMLTPVLGYAELAANTVSKSSPAAFMLDEIGKNARRAADLVQQILAYAGKGRFVIQAVDLSELIREMRGLLEAAVSVNTRLQYDLAAGIPAVEADATQLRQVVMNLVTNASEAVDEGGGTVTVRTGWDPAARALPPSSSKSPPPAGPSVFLEVADSGCGMSAEVREKIFDPFFTTKFTGRGLGLAVVQGIARGHRGTIEVRSEPGRGSAFRLLLPCSAKTVPVPVAAPASEDWRATGTLLLIDDDRQVRDIAARIFQQAGLAVLLAGNGEEGLAVFREQPTRIDAVVVDLTMPKMGGLQTARELRRLQPELPIVLMSGFSVQEVTLQSEGLGITAFVQKPFNANDLVAAVRQALGK